MREVDKIWCAIVTRPESQDPVSTNANSLERYDSRLKRLLNRPEFVLINNYKCGFSSSNCLKTRELVRISSDDEVILFYRNIFLRTVSTFINWCITDDRFKNNSGWLLRNMEIALGESEYVRFIGLLSGCEYERAFEIYIHVLESMHQQNAHTSPQVKLLEYYSIRNINHFIELENNDEFERLTGVAFPHDRTNQSNGTIKTRILRLLNDGYELQNRLRWIYQDDILFFERHGFSVDVIQAVAEFPGG